MVFIGCFDSDKIFREKTAPPAKTCIIFTVYIFQPRNWDLSNEKESSESPLWTNVYSWCWWIISSSQKCAQQ